MPKALLKTKAEDYLRDFASRNDESWLGNLIEEVVSKGALPQKKIIDGLYEEFCLANDLGMIDQKTKESQPFVIPSPTPVSISAEAGNLKLETLTHKKGVNALNEGEKMTFHQKLTVIFGKNGSGKSGFVRIIKRVSGSRTQENIWQNIHKSKTQNECEAEITYEQNNKKNRLDWNGENKVSPLDQLQVFDGKCIPIYLTRSLDFSYQPYGFELFSLVSNSLKELKNKLVADIQEKESEKPSFNNLFDNNTVIGKFVSSLDSETKKADLDKLPKWSSSAKRELSKKVKERRGLHNLDQKLENLQNRLQKLVALQGQLEKIQNEFSSKNIGLYLKLIKEYTQRKKKLATKKGKTLEDYEIPQMESDEWQKFIQVGEEYVESLHGEHYPKEDDHCVYCRQKLTKTAIKLIQLYRDLFKEKETSDFDKTESKLEDTISQLENTSFSEAFAYGESDFEKILSKKQIGASFNAIKEADEKTVKIADCLREKKGEKIKSLNLHSLIGTIEKKQSRIRSEIGEVYELQKNLDRRADAIEKAIAELKDVKAFSKQRSRVEKYITSENWITKANSTFGKLNTKPITELGGKAWKELVSDSFKKRFEKEARDLNAPTVNLDFHGEYGSQLREKNLEGLTKIDDFLSEGEQKAVALADFFAELSMQDKKAPVVFDDPATSFDHERKEKIAKRIVEESESKQVIVFTHDLMFASYIHDLVLDGSKGIDSNKASFHDLNAEGGRVGIITENYYPGSVKLDKYLPKIQAKITGIDELRGDTKTETIKTTYGMLRRAVEKVVEERIFGGIITRWSDRIQLLNLNATLNKEKLKTARDLHGEFSRYIEGHDQSNEMIHHAIASLDTLKADFEKVKNLAVR